MTEYECTLPGSVSGCGEWCKEYCNMYGSDRCRWDPKTGKMMVKADEPTASQTGNSDPLPCPFCQEKKVTVRLNKDYGTQYVYCIWCGARGPEGFDKDRAIEKWNERPEKKVME